MADEVERLSGKLGLDTTDFKTAVRGADREIRVLQSSFKASAASLVDWTKDATGLESRVKTLTSQIDIQKLKVAALAAEHKRLAEENGENSIAAQEAEIKLNKETETLNKMQVELSGTEQELQNMKEGTDEAGDSTEELGEHTEETSAKMKILQGVAAGLGVALGATVAAIAALGAAALAAVVGVSKLVSSASEAAAELVDLSAQTGISTTELQELSFIGDQVGTSLDTITGAQARLIRSMVTAREQKDKFDEALASGKNEDEIASVGDMQIAFNQLGVSVVDAGGNLRSQQAVFAEVIDALGRIQNPVERDALAMEIFGKSAQELNPLIKAGSAEMRRLAQEAHDVGAVMSEEDVAALEAFDDTMTALQAGLKGTLGTLAADFLPVFQQVFGPNGAGKYLKEFSQIIRGADGDFGKIAQGLTKLITEIATDIAKQAPQFLQSGLTIVQSILDAITAALPQMLTAATEIITTLFNFLVQALPQLLQAGVQILLTLIGSIVENLPLLVDAALQAIIALANGLAAALPELIPAVVEAIITIVTTLTDNIPLIVDAALKLILGLAQGLIVALPVLIAALPQIIDAILNALIDALPLIFEAAGRLIGMLATGIVAAIPVLLVAVGELIARLGNTLAVFIQKLPEIGKKFVQGLADGIKNATGLLYDEVTKLIQGMIDRIKSLLQMHSPSGVGIDIGENFLGSVGLGGLRKLPQVQQMFAFAAQSMAQALAGGSSQTNNTTNQTDSFQFFAPVVVQGSTPAGSLGARLKGRRY
jgi:hypothetical protein